MDIRARKNTVILAIVLKVDSNIISEALVKHGQANLLKGPIGLVIHTFIKEIIKKAVDVNR